ncbi:hypothetical protein BGZ80_008719 [Entomortierella chlamydospora]|uniref:Carrier domain-containing protein n=1 Tax=Entomortierella chlamydospora TaxID=101097 RepID=A0A9P6MWZ9_9FUNG|nr:hypothetical protein BGZ80_008719 [Entomortierella chlamydospora]
MPLTANAKINHKALPAPGEDAFSRETYEAPEGDIENKLATIWAQLLGINRIGRHDNFFALGGYSLLATKMLDHLRRLGLTASVRTLFESPTLSALAQAVKGHQEASIPPNLITLKTTVLTPEMLPLITLTQDDIDRIVATIPGGIANIQDIYAFAPLQDGILFHHLLTTEGDPYLITASMAFESKALLNRYLDAFQRVVDRHDILRTAFIWENLSTPVQVVCRNAALPVEELTLDPADGPIREQLNRRYNPRHYRIDLSQAPLLRFIIAKDSDGRWLLVQMIHHLICDHESTAQMNIEIETILNGQGKSLQEPRQFRDLIAQASLKSNPEIHEKFFKEMLADVHEPTFPFGLTSIHNDGTEVAESHQMLPQELNIRLRSQAKRIGVSLASLCHVAWAQVLARTSGQERVVFGTVLLGRFQAEVVSDEALGLSVNTLPFRCDMDNRGVRDCIRETHVHLAALLEHEHASLALAQRCSGVPAGTPLFSGLLNYRHTSLPSSSSSNTFDSEFVSEEEQVHYPGIEFLSGQERTNYPICLSVKDFGTALGLTSKTTYPIDPARVCGYMKRALESIADALEYTPNSPVQQLEVIPVEECELISQTWNATQQEYPEHLCLHHLFEQQVALTPNAVALVHEDQSLTYAELNVRANRLAHQLIELGVQPDDLVAICVERSPAMIIGILAILKAGGAYVPLDPFYASGRLIDILQDANPAIVLVDKSGRATLGQDALCSMTAVEVDALLDHPSNNPQVSGLSPRHLAYVIYTSGSTGKPKGVLIEHQGVVNLVTFRPEMFDILPYSRVLQFTSLSFDHSVSEIFSTLSCGASLYLVQDDIRLDKRQLWNFLKTHEITHVSLTPALLQDSRDMPSFPTLRTLIAMGEALTASLLQTLTNLNLNRIINAYGPTETTVGAVLWTCSPDFCGDIVPIGRPSANKYVYLLDEQLRPVPLGAVGEIYIGGVGVARGYLNRSELTNERFLPDPFAVETDARMYKTGDLARYLPDGNLMFLGRNDHQVKIRGFRIELGEIEARLVEHPVVSEAVVIALGEGTVKRLVAYVVARPDEQLANSLHSHLVERLPDYMIPAAYVRLDMFPLTPNGKLDRRALPTPDEDAFARQTYEEPQGEIEIALARIWTELLHLDRVSRHDNFFMLGGHSLLAVQMMERLRRIGYSVSVRALFDTPTLYVLAQSLQIQHTDLTPTNLITSGITTITPDLLPLIDLTQLDIDYIIEQVPGGVSNIQDIYALSPLQDGILFHHMLATKEDPYLLIAIMAFDNKVILNRYLNAMQQIVDRHDILRTAFFWKGLSTPAQVVLRHAPLSVTELKLDPADGPIPEQLKQRFDPRHYRIDLTKAPLLSFAIAQVCDGRWILAELMHHLIGDHSTRETMEVEIQAFFEGRGDTLPSPQPFRGLVAQARLGVSQEAHKRFFTEMLAEIDTPALPFGLVDVHGDGAEVTESFCMLPQDLNDRLRVQARALGVSLASLCHLAWGQVIAQASGQENVVFATVLFGRMQAGSGSESAMGLFINTLPIRVDLDECSVKESIRKTHARLAALIEHEHASLALAQRCSNVPAGTPLFSSLLNYRHNVKQLDMSSDVSGMELLDSQERTNYPFTISVEDFGDELGLTAQTVQQVGSARICGYMQQALQSLAEALEYTPDMAVRDLDILPAEERTLLIQTWNATQKEYPAHMCLHQLFEQQVALTPNAVAIVHEDESLTYAELNVRANRLAHQLIELGVQPDDLVAISVGRSPAMIIGTLAILKAGGAYVPLDPSHASGRLVDILQDANPAIVLVDRSGRASLGQDALYSMKVMDVDALLDHPSNNPQVLGLTSHHLAYVIYTSGSTGKPKGVMIEHHSVVNTAIDHAEIYGLDKNSRMIQFASVGFDASVRDIFMPLCCGGSVYIPPDNIRSDVIKLWEYMSANSITHVASTPSLLQDGKVLPPTQVSLTLLLGGEPLSPKLISQIAGQMTVYNNYGPTETTISVTSWRVPKDFSADIVPIGRPHKNHSVYILDAQRHPVPLGALGEIYIGGVGVARGYLNRPDLTEERFIPDPFVSEKGARMYKTGDLARFLPDGNIAYVGRNDHQVKIRGFRIELGEIEARLVEHPVVSEAVVIALGEGNVKRLVAYVVAKPDEQLANSLRSHLVERLPDYMIPAAYVRLDMFPLTSNDKLDRRALPTPDEDAFARQTYEEPQGETEIALAQIWTELLHLDRVSRHDNFFMLGGHSLLAVRLMNRISTLGVQLPLSSLFSSPRLSSLAEVVDTHLSQGCASLPMITPVDRNSVLPLSFAQQQLSVSYIDLRYAVDRDEQLLAATYKAVHTSFDLTQGPLIRVTLIQLADNEHILVLTLHHIISDGWSMGIMARELSQMYSAHCGGDSISLPSLSIQYPDYAAWQQQWFSGDRLKDHADFWRDTLVGAPILTELPTDRPRPDQQSMAGSSIPVSFDAELTASLNRISQEHGVTMFMTVLTAWSVILSRLSGQDDIVIGTPSANRSHHEMENIVGLFVNTLALRIDLSANPTVRNLLDRVRQRTLAAYEHQNMPFEQVVQIVQPPRKTEHTPLFQVMFSWQNNETSEWDFQGLEASYYELEYEIVKFDLELDLYEENGEIVGNLSFSTALFNQSTMERYMGYLRCMLQAMCDNVNQTIDSVDIISSEERTLLLQTWNAVEQEYPTHETMHQLFERQVECTPEVTALVYEEDALSYKELNERANRLAHYLVELGVKPDSRVAICVKRSLAMVVGTMAILKAGGAFVPLDPSFASERLQTILSDAAPTVLLADAAGIEALRQADTSMMTIVDPNKNLSHPTTNVSVPGLTSRHLAYIIYTSGSTGKPKGVMLEHRGLANLAQTHTKFCGILEHTRLMQFASFSFDASVWDIMLPLSSGAALYLPPDSIRIDRDALWRYMGHHSITHASFTPSFLQEGRDLPPLKNPLTLILGGEALTPTLLRNLTRQGITVVNDYGPTEVTVSAATWRCPTQFDDTFVPIGKPVIHSRLYVLDAQRQLVPIGAVGELYVGGVGVARGYLNRPELTSEMFIPDPFVSDADVRMYRTGDLVRYLPDGNLLYLGRKDNQVKIRGFRIELGEIEGCLLDHPSVSEAVVVVMGEGTDKRLVAYVVSELKERLSPQLRAHVAAKLPRYMVPGAFVRLDTMPLTSNDKLDRKALEDIPFTSEEYNCLDDHSEPELDPTQLAIHNIWKRLLPSSPTWIPVTESFFDLGGHSILATRMICEVRLVCNVNLPLNVVFRAPTIASMAKEVVRTRMDTLEVDPSQSSKNTAAADQKCDFSYSNDFEELRRTEIQEVYSRIERQDKVNYQTFFLTGATGFLGAFILSNLLVEDPVTRVICLARAPSEEEAMDRVRSCGELYQTWNEEWVTSGRLSVVKGDLELERFGLSPEIWEKLCNQVDVIIHNGASVNGLLPYSTIRSANVLGTLQGIKMASTYHTKSFHFVSSASVLETAHYYALSEALAKTKHQGVPETDDLEGSRYGLHSGYCQSKWVAEKLVMAANKNGLPATIIRPGYIVGHTRTGVTNTSDILWRLIKGCIEIKSAPNMNAPVDFSPVDYVAHCVVSVATTPGTETAMVYQVTHPMSPPFRLNDFIQAMSRFGYEVETIEGAVWRAALVEHTLKNKDTILYPLLHMDIDDLPGTSNSPEMSDMHTQKVIARNDCSDPRPRIHTDQIGRYLAYMAKVGFIKRPTLQGGNVLPLPVID